MAVRKVTRQLYSLSPTVAVGILALIAGILAIHGGNRELRRLPFVRINSGSLAQAVGLDILYRPSPTSHRHTDIQVFSQDPLVLYIHDFLSPDEISHLLKASIGRFEPSRVYSGKDSFIDTSGRISESAALDPDDVTDQIKQRATRIRGWKGNGSHFVQQLRTQRYGVGGFYTFHYDWDAFATQGNRVATFMVYLVGDCTGGGTNFPKLDRAVDDRWCSSGAIDCDNDDGYPGVTFRPVAGSAVYWENLHGNGSLHRGVEHAALPVKSGEKVGLNIWFWDPDWSPPPGEDDRLDW